MNEDQYSETETKKEADETIINEEGQGEKASNPNQSMFSKKLSEIIILIQNIRQRLKDLSIERRTEVSQIQWTTLEEFKLSQKVPLKPVEFWQKSLFARIYFVDEDLDEIFQNIMKYSSIFYQYLNQFNDKVQCRNVDDHFHYAVTRLSNNVESTNTNKSPQEFATNSSLLKMSQTAAPVNVNNEETDVSDMGDIQYIQKSFIELMRAKIDFDSQFLNFNSTLSKNCFSEDFLYLYKICANSNVILGQTSLSIDNQSSQSPNKKKLKRKRLSNELKEKRHKKQLRKSIRIASGEDSSEVEVIHSLRRREIV